MLLDGIAIDGVVQVKREVGVEIEERAREVPIGPQRAGVVEGLAVVSRQGAQYDAPAVGGIDVPEAVEEAGGHQVERNLAGRIKIVAAEEEPEPEFLVRAERLGEVGVHIVAAVAEGILERAVGIGCVIGEVGVDGWDIRAVGQKGAAGIEVAALRAQGEHVRQRLPLAYVHHAQAAEIAVLRAERAVNDGDFLD